jgi:hypothetical protein
MTRSFTLLKTATQEIAGNKGIRIMKNIRTITAVALVLILAGTGSVFARGRGMGFSITTLPYETPSSEEEAAILKMREEEKLARDVYTTLYEKWGNQTFKKIAASEQKHMDAVKGLIEKYSLTDPVANDATGAFTSPEYQELYEKLVAQGQASQVDALQVGATIEDLDIFDLKETIEKADNQDVRTVFQNLMKGSRNHMRSFCWLLSAMNAGYTAQYLSESEIQQILSSPREKGPVDADGRPVHSGGSGKHGQRGKGRRF